MVDELAPVAFENLPWLHLIQLNLFAAASELENVPFEQFRHVEALVAPLELLHFPASHGMHFSLSKLEYVPLLQALHGSPTLLTWPFSQSRHIRFPSVPIKCFPAEHTAQYVWPCFA